MDDSQYKYVGTGARAMLNPEQYAEWKRANDEAFDRLPAQVRLAIRETGVDVDCTKLEAALKTVPEFMVIDEIFKRVNSQNDQNTRRLN